MKTTLRARMMRLCCLSVITACIVMMSLSLICSHDMAKNDGKVLSEYTVNTCVNSVNDEIVFLKGKLADAELSEDGDETFESITVYGGEYGSMSGLKEGEMALVSMNKNDNALVAVISRSDGLIAGELEPEYLAAYINRMSDNGGLGIVCDTDGDIKLSSNLKLVPTGVNVKDCGLEWLTDEIRKGAAGSRDSASNSLTESGSNMVTYSPIGDTGLFAVYAEDLGVLYARFQTLFIFMIIGTLAAIVVSVIISFNVSNSICRPVSETIDRVVKLAEGDLTSPCAENTRGDETQVLSDSLKKMIANFSSYVTDIDNVLSEVSKGDLRVKSAVEYMGDFASIRDSLDGICENLRATMTAIDEAGEQVFSDSDSVSEGARLLSENSTTEAASLEQINSMAADIAMRVGHNTDNTHKATSLLGNIVSIVEDGNVTMTQMSEAMSEIKEASDKIQSVVKAIDDIAFQTNILALNAAVEAARAGEAGKGFAVVADEVRNLASKSSEAAQNTMQLVQYCSDAVDRGSTLTEKTDTSFRTIDQSVSEFSELMNNIAISSAEQSEAIQQINQGLDSITGIVQSNSAAARESAESSRKLKAQADILSQKVQTFRL